MANGVDSMRKHSYKHNVCYECSSQMEFQNRDQLLDHIHQTMIRIRCNHKLCIDQITDFHSNPLYIGYNSNHRCYPNIVSILRNGDHTNWEHKYWRFHCNDKVYNSLLSVKDFRSIHCHTFRSEVLHSLLDMRCKYILKKKTVIFFNFVNLYLLLVVF